MAFIARPSGHDVDVVHAAAPLAAGRTLRCGPFDVPVGMVAATPTLEDEDSVEAEVLRQFLADDPWHGMGSVFPGGWLLLARDEDTIVFGQREGRIGLGHVVTLVRRDAGWEARSMGGARLRTGRDAERITAIHGVTAEGPDLTLDWTNGVDHDLVVRVEHVETDDAVHLVLVVEPGPNRDQRSGWRYDVGISDTARVTLRRGLGDRVVLDDGGLPPRRVERVSR